MGSSARIQSPSEDCAQFGRFLLSPGERRLLEDGAPIRLGGRAFDILILLVRAAGQIVSQQALQETVWPNVTVEPGSLRVQMTALRKALRDGEEGPRYVATIPGRGYCFVAPVTWTSPNDQGFWNADKTALPKLKPLWGRDEVIIEVMTKLVETRFVTIAGTGGVGKTAIALAVAHALVSAFNGEVHFFDLSTLSSPQTALPMLRRAVLRRFSATDKSFPPIAESMRGKRILLVFDCCDFMTVAMAELIESIVSKTEGVHVLATSREVLQVPGETVITPPILKYPIDSSTLSAEALRGYPAVNLLVELVSVSVKDFQPSLDDLRSLSTIASKLDGLPLALQLAANSISEGGIEKTLPLIASRFLLFISDRGAHLPRHESLNAALEWSYEKLTPDLRIIFHNSSIFPGRFTLESILHVTVEPGMTSDIVAYGFKMLVAKSLIDRDESADIQQFRLLDTTRAFALSKLLTLGNANKIKRRHAEYVEYYFTNANKATPGLPFGRNAYRLSAEIDNVRAALEWCFSAHGNPTLGTTIAAASARIFLVLGLVEEGEKWFALALRSLEQQSLGTRLEFELRFAVFICKTASPRSGAEVQSDIIVLVGLADKCADIITRIEVRALECMWCAQARNSDETLNTAITARSMALSLGDYPTQLLTDWVLGFVYHLRGSLSEVADLCDSAAQISFTKENAYFSTMHKAAQVCALGSSTRTLWLQGRPSAALKAAHATLDHPGNLVAGRSNVPIFFIPLYIWAGEWDAAESLISFSLENIIDEGDRPFLLAFRGEIDLKRGNLESAFLLLKDCEIFFQDFPPFAQMGVFAIHLAETLALLGQFDLAKKAMDRAVAVGEMFGESFFEPERYRVMGVVTSIGTPSQRAEAEKWFIRAIQCAERQGSLSFALRAATNLAVWYDARGSQQEARAVLSPIYNRFAEGFETVDLVAARTLLNQLDRSTNDTSDQTSLI